MSEALARERARLLVRERAGFGSLRAGRVELVTDLQRVSFGCDRAVAGLSAA